MHADLHLLGAENAHKLTAGGNAQRKWPTDTNLDPKWDGPDLEVSLSGPAPSWAVWNKHANHTRFPHQHQELAIKG